MLINPLPEAYKKYQSLVYKLNTIIDNKQLIEFPYLSNKGTATTLRKVEPYLVVIDKKTGSIKLVGYPTNRIPPDDQLRHYLLDKLDIDDIVVLNEKFNRLRVGDDQVFDTPKVLVICRVNFE